jgi:hypothetical protein
VQKTSQTSEMATLIDALSEADAVELRNELLKTALDRDRSGIARFTASLIPEEIRNDRADCASWVLKNTALLKDALQAN